jgi:hypothetical protein
MSIKSGALLLLVCACSIQNLSAQSYSETALTFSRISPAGSSRMIGIGGAGVSLGGDPSSAYLNPAGLGMFNKGEFAFSLGYGDVNSTSNYLNTQTGSDQTTLNIPFMGFSLQGPLNHEKIISGTLGVSFNRINDFNQTISYSGRNTNNSIIDYFLNDAYDEEGSPIDPRDLFLPTNLAFESYLIDTITVNGVTDYWSALGLLPDPEDFRNVTQSETITTKGAQTQWTFSYGINVADKFFAGAGIGIRKIRYESRKNYQESDFEFLDTDYNPLNSFRLDETLTVDGSGTNFQLGFIARPVQGLQAGVSWESPTYYEIADVYSASVNADWNNFDYYQNGSLRLNEVTAQLDESLVTEYKLRTPGRITAGLSYIFGKRGFITAEAETVNYNNSKYTSLLQGVSFESDNATIKTLYRPAVNYRAGGEVRVDRMRFRVGGFYREDPFQSVQNNVSRKIIGITGGIGYREKKYYTDLSIAYTQGDQSYRPYRIPGDASPLVKTSMNQLFIQATLGLLMADPGNAY